MKKSRLRNGLAFLFVESLPAAGNFNDGNPEQWWNPVSSISSSLLPTILLHLAVKYLLKTACTKFRP
jgi:predicted phosphohydrolase